MGLLSTRKKSNRSKSFRDGNVFSDFLVHRVYLMWVLKSGKDVGGRPDSLLLFCLRMSTFEFHGSKRIHRISLGLASFLAKRYFIAEWSCSVLELRLIAFEEKNVPSSRKLGLSTPYINVFSRIRLVFQRLIGRYFSASCKSGLFWEERIFPDGRWHMINACAQDRPKAMPVLSQTFSRVPFINFLLEEMEFDAFWLGLEALKEHFAGSES
ncbi:hypothetical protein Tco_1082221 [Tanacetum coccineum]|uniref:Maturase K n=1 Tax=Tanacetum coccineum TaxID=301880 RepID=A0ABQ5HZQ8_9ASTR